MRAFDWINFVLYVVLGFAFSAAGITFSWTLVGILLLVVAIDVRSYYMGLTKK